MFPQCYYKYINWNNNFGIKHEHPDCETFWNVLIGRNRRFAFVKSIYTTEWFIFLDYKHAWSWILNICFVNVILMYGLLIFTEIVSKYFYSKHINVLKCCIVFTTFWCRKKSMLFTWGECNGQILGVMFS